MQDKKRIYFFKIIIEYIQSENIQSQNFKKYSKVRHWKYCKSTLAHISQVLGYFGVAQGKIEECNKRIFFFKVIIQNIQSENIQNRNFENFLR